MSTYSGSGGANPRSATGTGGNYTGQRARPVVRLPPPISPEHTSTLTVDRGNLEEWLLRDFDGSAKKPGYCFPYTVTDFPAHRSDGPASNFTGHAQSFNQLSEDLLGYFGTGQSIGNAAREGTSSQFDWCEKTLLYTREPEPEPDTLFVGQDEELEPPPVSVSELFVGPSRHRDQTCKYGNCSNKLYS